MAKTKKVIDKPQLAVTLKIYVTPRSNGKVSVTGNLKHHCGSKEIALDVLEEFINHARKHKVDA